jgi:hypothetical protein
VSLTFTDDPHVYTLDGDRVPSVTTIVGTLSKGDGLMRWATGLVAKAVVRQGSTIDAVRAMGDDALVAALVALPGQARDKAKRRGSLVHKLAEGVVRGDPTELIADPDIAACVGGLAQWFDGVGFEPELVEVMIASRACRYAGRLDVVGTFEADRSLRWLLDLKTSSGVYGETVLQLGAYARAEFYLDDGVEVPLPRIDRIGVVHVQPGISELYELGDVDTAFEEFRAAQTLYTSNGRRRRLVAHPVARPVAAPDNVRALF